MKTKIIIVTLATLALLGCGNAKESTVSAEVPPYWTEIARQQVLGRTMITMVDADNHVIVVNEGYRLNTAIQIK